MWFRRLPGSAEPQRRYEMIRCLDKMLCHHFYPHILYIVNFDGDFWGWSLGIPRQKQYDCDHYNVWARDPLRIPQFFSFNISTLWGHVHNDTYWYSQVMWNINDFVPPLVEPSLSSGFYIEPICLKSHRNLLSSVYLVHRNRAPMLSRAPAWARGFVSKTKNLTRASRSA